MARSSDATNPIRCALVGDQLSLKRVFILASEAFTVALLIGLLVNYVSSAPQSVVWHIFHPTSFGVDPAVTAVAVLGWIALAAIVATRGSGLFGCWLVIFGAFYGWYLVDYAIADSVCCVGTTDTTYELIVNPLLAAVPAIVAALIAGTLGFVVGRAGTMLSHRLT